jgi:uroporphyrinogen-III synthase
VIEDGTAHADIRRLSQSLATLLHTFTLSSAALPDSVGSSLRSSSRELYALASGPSPDKSHAASIIERVTSSLSAPEFHSFPSESTLTALLGLCRSIHHALNDRSQTGDRIGSADPLISDRLRGIVVLITRPLSQSTATAKLVEGHGGIPVVVPTIEIADPDDWYPVDHSIVNLKGYDGVIFTSQNAAERFLGRVAAINATALRVVANRRVYAVGAKTRASLENAQIPVTLIPERFSAMDLVSVLRKEPLAGRRFLFPKGNLAKDEIPDALRTADAVVDEIEVYKTVGAEGQTLIPLRQAVRNGEIDSIVFFSPSAVLGFAGVIDAADAARSVIACIGPTTTQAAESAGYQTIIMAEEATAESIVESLARLFKR